MNKANFIRLSGWLLMASAVAFMPGAIGMGLSVTRYAVRNWDIFPFNVAAFAVFWAPLLLAVGILGLRARYGSAIGAAGRGMLLFDAIVGGLLVVIGTLVQFLTPDYSVSETYYGVWLGGVYLLYTCLSIFGVVAVLKKPLPRWNGSPLIAGILITLAPILAVLGVKSPQSDTGIAITILALFIMTTALIMLGYVVQADAQEKPTSA